MESPNASQLPLSDVPDDSSHLAIKALKWFAVASCVYGLLVAVTSISTGFKLVSGGSENASYLLSYVSNPFTGLLIGTLVTALVQSSSTVTSVIVGLVAGGLPIEIAIPMIMGANIGTTVTNTFVSLGHITKRADFKRAFAAATVHDFFNLINVIIFLPIEIMFGFLQKISAILTQYVAGAFSIDLKSYGFVKTATKAPVKEAMSHLDHLSNTASGSIMIALGILFIILSITTLSWLLKQIMSDRAQNIFRKTVGKNPISAIGSGTALTVLVQSSSTTTSLAVPFAGQGVLTLKQVYPFTLGANIGTCVTALLAAITLSGSGALLGLQIALVHLIYNTLGVVIIYGIPLLRNIPLALAEKLASLAAHNRLYAAGYVFSIFFVLPSLVIVATQ